MHVAIERNSWRLPQDDVVQVVNPKSKIKEMPDVSTATAHPYSVHRAYHSTRTFYTLRTGRLAGRSR